MNPDLVPMLLDVSVDPCDGSVHPSLQYVLMRGFAAMGWEQPQAASEDMAMEILKMIRPNLASGGTVAPSVQPLIGERPLCQPPRPDAGGGVRATAHSAAWEAYVEASMDPDINSFECIKRAVDAALSNQPAAVERVVWTPELEAARLELCEFWVGIADDLHEGKVRYPELGRKALETEQALTILGEIAKRPAAAESNASAEARLREALAEAISAVGDEAKKSEGISAIHSALSKANIEYSGYSCNGVNLVGDHSSIKAAIRAFHSHSQIDDLVRNLRHWRDECGKLHARLKEQERPSDPTADRRGIVARALMDKWPGDYAWGDDRPEPNPLAFETADAILAALDGGAGA